METAAWRRPAAKKSGACPEKRTRIDGMGVSVRRACKGLKFDMSTYHFKSRRTWQVGFNQRIGIGTAPYVD
jgi:hypothetical protein